MSSVTWQFSTLVLALLIWTTVAVPAPAPAPGPVPVPQQFQGEVPHTLLDIETPNSFNYNSPLQHPDSLRSRPYFDFLSTLYRRDSAKSDLFRPYSRTRRDAESTGEKRKRRAIVFRPLFVYKQQQVRKKEIQQRRRSTRV
ncbi:uncharacterized protein LOC115633682 [Scaptodrosophila lebanonensis]|uniref:Uncharacterized protein LOC115633682 n=1 Tax=Drosophila lebanonensis TaxID=7225 RepID=A0A6J2UEV0_DROLE|nr:uncharacterized protein LOC115633682 [Scaptodrosophila lebanonensis]